MIPKGLINCYSDLETSIQVNRFLLLSWRKAILNAHVLQACEIQVCHRHVDCFARDTTEREQIYQEVFEIWEDHMFLVIYIISTYWHENERYVLRCYYEPYEFLIRHMYIYTKIHQKQSF